MGQYRLWLQQRGIDHNLRTQLTQYEQELAHIDEQIAHLEKTVQTNNNPVLAILLQNMLPHGQLTNSIQHVAQAQTNGHEITTKKPDQEEEQTKPPIEPKRPVIASTFLSWSELPNFDHREIQGIDDSNLPIGTSAILPEIADPLLPDDLNELLGDENRHTLNLPFPGGYAQ